MNRWYITKVHAGGSNLIWFGDYDAASSAFNSLIQSSDVLYAQLYHEDGEVRRQFVRVEPGVELEEESWA